MSLKRLVRRHGLQADWDAEDPLIWEGEVAWATDTGVFKVGDGAKTWSQLTALSASGGGGDDLRPFQAGTGTFTESEANGSTSFGYTTNDGAIAAAGKGSTAFGYAYGAGSQISSPGVGAVASGYALTGGTVEATEKGATAFGYAASEGGIAASYSGATAFGYAIGTGTITARYSGALATGFVKTGGIIDAFDSGSIAAGYAGDGAKIETLAGAAFAFGSSFGAGGLITSSGNGSIAAGYAYTSEIAAQRDGSMAFGYATSGYAITSAGRGAFAGGNAVDADILASDNGAFQWGPGTNDVPDSLQVGATARIEPGAVVLDKTAGTGFKVDLATPDYPWRDLIGLLVVDEAGVNAASLQPYRGGAVREYAFQVGDKVDIRFHMPHDYAPGTDLFIHMHWSHNGTAITGTGTISATVAHSYAKGFAQGQFTAEETVTITNANVTTATVPQYRHMIEEVQLSASGGAGGLLDSDILEVDGLLLVNFTMDTIPTITGGTQSIPFVHAIDIHYQSTGMGTSQKQFPFWA